MARYEDDYFEDDMINAAELAAHQPQDDDTVEYVSPGISEDPVDHPRHYKNHPSGIECIQITEHMNFCLGNATKYIWRAGLKSDDPVEDLMKARWYISRELKRLGDADA